MEVKKNEFELTAEQMLAATYVKVSQLQSTFDKVLECAMRHHQKETTSPAGNIYLAAASPELPLTVIREEEAFEYLPCFDESDALYGLPNLPILMSYCPAQVLSLGENETYLMGPMLFLRADEDGNTISLTMDDLYDLAEYLESHSVTLMTDGQACIAIRLD